MFENWPFDVNPKETLTAKIFGIGKERIDSIVSAVRMAYEEGCEYLPAVMQQACKQASIFDDQEKLFMMFVFGTLWAKEDSAPDVSFTFSVVHDSTDMPAEVAEAIMAHEGCAECGKREHCSSYHIFVESIARKAPAN